MIGASVAATFEIAKLATFQGNKVGGAARQKKNAVQHAKFHAVS